MFVQITTQLFGILSRFGLIQVTSMVTEVVEIPETEQDFMLHMPGPCPFGGYPVLLLCDGEVVTRGCVDTVHTSNELIGHWAKEFGIPVEQVPAMATYAADQIAQFERERYVESDEPIVFDADGLLARIDPHGLFAFPH